MSENRPVKAKQHEHIRVPQGWTGQARELIIQLDRIFDDVYSKIGKIEERLKNLEQE